MIRATKLEFMEGTTIRVTFSDGSVKELDLSTLYGRNPQLKQLDDRAFFTSGKLGSFAIAWGEYLDIDVDTVYEEGKTV